MLAWRREHHLRHHRHYQSKRCHYCNIRRKKNSVVRFRWGLLLLYDKSILMLILYISSLLSYQERVLKLYTQVKWNTPVHPQTHPGTHSHTPLQISNSKPEKLENSPVVVLKVNNIGGASSPANAVVVGFLAWIHKRPHAVVVETVALG